LGLHNGNWLYARSNRTPRFARRSRFGVFTIGWPYVPKSLLRSSEMISRTFGLLCADTVAAVKNRVAAKTARQCRMCDLDSNRTRRNPRFDVGLLISDLPRLPTRYRAQY